MALPELIEIVPLTGPVRAEIAVPGSKSITNRALVLAALAKGETTLRGALWSEDTQVMVACLQQLGFTVGVAPDPVEFCNRTITVQGLGGVVPQAGTEEKPLELFVGNAGTAARFLSALVCLGRGVYRLNGVARMDKRPQAALFKALRDLGYRLDSANDRMPAVIHGTGPQAGNCSVSIGESSQFASALLLCAQVGGWHVKVVGENAEESPYVEMTRELIKLFPKRGGAFQIEPDASSGSYFWAAGFLMGEAGKKIPPVAAPAPAPAPAAGSAQVWPGVSAREDWVTVKDWPETGWQIDADFPAFYPLPSTISREGELGDSIMTAIVLAPFGSRPIHFTDLGRLRVQECERVQALRVELARCGAPVVEHEDTLDVSPSPLHGAEIETYNDHRMAMCFAILGLKVPGIKIKNPACVKKTFPNFFQKLAAAPPAGLGVAILDAKTRKGLSDAELFAD